MGAVLRELDLSGNSLTNNGTELLGWRAFCTQLALARSLTRLSCAGCGLGDAGVGLLAAALAPNDAGVSCSLSHLDVSDNGVGVAGVRRLVEPLTPCVEGNGLFNTRLSELRLGGNPDVGDAGFSLLRLGPLARRWLCCG